MGESEFYLPSCRLLMRGCAGHAVIALSQSLVARCACMHLSTNARAHICSVTTKPAASHHDQTGQAEATLNRGIDKCLTLPLVASDCVGLYVELQMHAVLAVPRCVLIDCCNAVFNAAISLGFQQIMSA